MMSTPTTNTQTGTTNTVAVAMSSQSASIRYKVPILEDADGYAHWHFCMTMVLEESDLMGITDGTLTKPNTTADPSEYTDWMSKDHQAHIQITTTLQKGTLNLILQAKTAKECWEKLEAQYQGKGGHHIAYLMESFFQSPLSNTEPMEPQLNKLVEVSCNLNSISCSVNNKTLIYIIIMALPNTLSMLKSILFNKDNTTITSEVIISQILVDEEHRVHTSGGTMTTYFNKARKKPQARQQLEQGAKSQPQPQLRGQELRQQ